jgi:DNA-binding NarL/FixJ family response regulator
MPIMDGLRAAREIATVMPTVPILMYTRHTNWGIELEVKESGVRMLVPKTGDGGELFSTIETMLSSEP